MRKISASAAFGIFVPLLLVIYSVYQHLNIGYDYYAKTVLFREKQILVYSKLAEQMSETGAYDQVPTLLQDAVNNHMFDWFAISFRGELVSSYPTELGNTLNPERMPTSLVDDPEISLITVALKPETKLTLGINKNPEAYLRSLRTTFLPVLMQDLLVPTLVALSVFLFFLKDVLKIVKLVVSKSKDRSQIYQSLSSRTKEGQVLKQAITNLELHSRESEQKRKKMESELLPSLRHELASGITPPYYFHAALVRLDINRYSEMFLSPNREKLVQLVNEFFHASAEIVSLYDGLIYEFIGDEILYYVKENEQNNSTEMALASVRDIFAIANEFSPRFAEIFGHNLRVKAAVCPGLLRFGPLVNTHTLAGPILIESVRILGQIEERDDNRVVLPERQLEGLNLIAHVAPYKISTLKGFTDLRKLYSVTQFQPVSEDERKIGFFRRATQLNQNLEALLSDTQSLIKNLDPALVSKVSNALLVLSRQNYFELDRKTLELLVEFLKLRISTKDSGNIADSPLEIEHATLALTRAYISSANLDVEKGAKEIFEVSYAKLKSLQKNSDEKIAMGLIQILDRFPQFVSEVKEFLKWKNLRVQVAALGYFSQRDLTPEIGMHWITVFQTCPSEDLSQTSAELKSVLACWVRKDPLYLQAAEGFQQSIRQIIKSMTLSTVDKSEISILLDGGDLQPKGKLPMSSKRAS